MGYALILKQTDMNKNFIIYLLLCLPTLLKGQESIKSYVIGIDNGKVYLDITAPKVKIGDVFSIREEAGYMVHPVSKKKIEKVGTVIADLKIVEVFDEYSVAVSNPENVISRIKEGMIAEMPELLQEEIVSKPNTIIQPLVKDVDGIVQRYLQVTGLNQWFGKTFPAYYMKKEILSMDKNSKEIPYSSLSIVEPSTHKLYIKIETSRRNFFLTYCYAIVINGNEGWVKFRKSGLAKLKKQQIQESKGVFDDIFELSFFDTSKWNRKLCGAYMEQGQPCTGIEFTSLTDGKTTKMYFNDETGLVLCVETKGVKITCLQYKKYGDLLLCSSSLKIISTGKQELRESMEMQEFILNYPVSNILFTKEMAKNAFEKVDPGTDTMYESPQKSYTAQVISNSKETGSDNSASSAQRRQNSEVIVINNPQIAKNNPVEVKNEHPAIKEELPSVTPNSISDVDSNIPYVGIKNTRTYVVVIANENYQSEVKVPYAQNDGKMFAEYCNQVLGVPSENIDIFEDASYNNIRKAINNAKMFADAAGKNARIIFYYAGHGIPDEISHSAYLLPIDGYGSDVTTGYKLDNLYTDLGNLPVASVTVFIDACFSGSKREGDKLLSARGISVRVKQGIPLGNMVVFTASSGDETAYHYQNQSHGLFTYFLLKKLKETRGDVTYDDLFSYIQSNVKMMSFQNYRKIQTPTVRVSERMNNVWKAIKINKTN